MVGLFSSVDDRIGVGRGGGVCGCVCRVYIKYLEQYSVA